MITKTFGLILNSPAEFAGVGLALASLTATDKIILQPNVNGDGTPYLLFQCQQADVRAVLNAFYETAQFAPDVETADAAFGMWERLHAAATV